MSCIVTPKPPAPHAPCMRALAPSYDTCMRALAPSYDSPDCRVKTLDCM